jgi:Uma2 family endonuclease
MSTVREQSAETRSPGAGGRADDDQKLAERLFTVEEYDRMIEMGILDEDERIELIEGRILKMSPKSVRHAALTDTAANYLSKRLGDRAVVRNQNPIRLAG